MQRNLRKLLATTLITLVLLGVIQAQGLPSAPPPFDVASVKPSGPLDAAHCGGDGPSPGRLVMSCSTLHSLVQSAYGTFAHGQVPVPKQLQIAGGPNWFDSERYDVDAKAGGNAPLDQMAGPMLQTLLEDRFKLKLHREDRETPVYALTIAKSGLKIQPMKDSCVTLDPMKLRQPPVPGQPQPNYCGTTRMQRKGQLMVMDFHSMSAPDFAAALSFRMDRTVIDKTGVVGLYDFHLEFAPDDTTPGFPSAPDAGGASIFTAIQELGLRLESAKAPIEFLVIDHVEKPSGN